MDSFTLASATASTPVNSLDAGLPAGLISTPRSQDDTSANLLNPASDVFTVASADSLFAPASVAPTAAPTAFGVANTAAAPNPADIIDDFMGGRRGNRLDKDGLGAHLAQEYVLKGDADTALAVIDQVRGRDQDDVTRALVGSLSDEQLAQIASTDEGLETIKGLRRPLLEGRTGRKDKAANERLETAFYSNEGHFNEIADRIQLAASIYQDTGAPEGWTRLSDSPDGLPAELRDLPWDQEFAGGSGLHAELYQSDEGETVLVFEGSGEVRDWLSNLQQGLGQNPEHYRQAIEIAQKVHEVYGDDMAITGHSLGGGLAAAAGTIVGVETTTFNAAGVHPNTLEPFGLERSDAIGNVEAFHVQGDLLNGLQDNDLQKGVLGAISALVPFIPNDAALTEAVGDRFSLPAVNGGNPAQRHALPVVAEGLEAKRPGAAA
ncbi:MAG: hypothetical protein AAF772_09910 [Acidobacteriota bacterium]